MKRNMNRQLNKNLVLITRCVLFVLGAVVGATAMMQFLHGSDRVNESLKIVFYIASGLVAALVLMFSAKPILYLVFAIGDGLKKIFGRTKPMDIAGILMGICIGLMLSYLAEVLLSMVLTIASARIIICIIIALTGSYIAALLCVKWLGSDGTEEEVPDFYGFLLTESALKNDKIVMLCKNWLSGGVWVLNKTLNALIDNLSDPQCAKALKHYRELDEGKLIKTSNYSADKSGIDLLTEFASNKRLKLIVESRADYKAEETLPVLALDEL